MMDASLQPVMINVVEEAAFVKKKNACFETSRMSHLNVVD